VPAPLQPIRFPPAPPLLLQGQFFGRPLARGVLLGLLFERADLFGVDRRELHGFLALCQRGGLACRFRLRQLVAFGRLLLRIGQRALIALGLVARRLRRRLAARNFGSRFRLAVGFFARAPFRRTRAARPRAAAASCASADTAAAAASRSRFSFASRRRRPACAPRRRLRLLSAAARSCWPRRPGFRVRGACARSRAAERGELLVAILRRRCNLDTLGFEILFAPLEHCLHLGDLRGVLLLALLLLALALGQLAAIAASIRPASSFFASSRAAFTAASPAAPTPSSGVLFRLHVHRRK
jgi:hypothetical protein